jgi:hypothetical protein
VDRTHAREVTGLEVIDSNPSTTEAVVNYLFSLYHDKKYYSVLNTHKAICFYRLGYYWCSNTVVISKFMKGIFHCNLPTSKYKFTWDVTVVLNFLKSLFPLQTLSLKLLTFKVVALIAMCCAPRAQTMVSLN